MAVTITHPFVSTVYDLQNPGEVGPNDWNAEHTLAGAAALTRVDDTNVTLTLGGTPTTALLESVSLTVGWTGTLAAGRLNSNVVQAITNDTNITGSIAAQNLTLSWAGTLAAARLNSNVVQAVTSDTNVTGSITSQNLTLGWSGTLSLARGGLGGSQAAATSGQVPVFPGSGGAAVPTTIRVPLSGAVTYYVRTDGSDSNNGLTDSAGGAFLTWQRAVDVVSDLDFGGNTVTIRAGNEVGVKTFNGLISIGRLTGGGQLVLEGRLGGAKSDVILTHTAGVIVLSNTVTPVAIGALTIQSTGGYASILVAYQSKMQFMTEGPVLGAATTARIWVHDTQAVAEILSSNYSVSGNSSYLFVVAGNGLMFHEASTVTLVGTPAFSVVLLANTGGYLQWTSNTIVGSATGQTRFAYGGGQINHVGAALPGSLGEQHTLTGVFNDETDLTGIVRANGTVSPIGITDSLGLLNAIPDATGTGALVFATTPTLVTPVLGAATGTSIVLGTDTRAASTYQLSVGKADGDSSFWVGQSVTRGGLFGWAYNANPALASLSIGTQGFSNPIGINGSTVAINQASLGATYLFGNVYLGTTGNGYVKATSGLVSFAAGVAVADITGLGTGVATALAVNVGTAGAPVINGGALGSPSSVGTMPSFSASGSITAAGASVAVIMNETGGGGNLGYFGFNRSGASKWQFGLQSTFETDGLLLYDTRNTRYAMQFGATIIGPGVDATYNLGGTSYRWIKTYSGVFNAKSYTVATLPTGAAGDIAYATDLRVFNGSGLQEGAGAGTGGHVTYNGTAWKVMGTNVTAVA